MIAKFDAKKKVITLVSWGRRAKIRNQEKVFFCWRGIFAKMYTSLGRGALSAKCTQYPWYFLCVLGVTLDSAETLFARSPFSLVPDNREHSERVTWKGGVRCERFDRTFSVVLRAFHWGSQEPLGGQKGFRLNLLGFDRTFLGVR